MLFIWTKTQSANFRGNPLCRLDTSQRELARKFADCVFVLKYTVLFNLLICSAQEETKRKSKNNKKQQQQQPQNSNNKTNKQTTTTKPKQA